MNLTLQSLKAPVLGMLIVLGTAFQFGPADAAAVCGLYCTFVGVVARQHGRHWP